MTTSYSVTRDQIITAALRKLNAVDLADSVDSLQLNNAAVALNLMIKMWAAEGLKLWKNVELKLPLVASTNLYILGAGTTTGIKDAITGSLSYDKPMKLNQAWLRNTSITPNIDTPMQILSKQEYNVLGSKYSTGTANSVFLDPRVTTSNLYLYLSPDNLVPTIYELHFNANILISDLNSGTDVPDFPIEWMQALVWGLADQLAIEYSVPANHRAEIANKAERYKADMEAYDVDNTSTFFTPDLRFGIKPQ